MQRPRELSAETFGPSARVILDDEVRLHHHRIGDLVEERNAGELRYHLVVIDLDVVGYVALLQSGRLDHGGELFGLFPHLDHVARLDPEARNRHAPAVDLDVAVTDELPGGEHGRHEFRPIDDGVEPALQQPDQVRAGIALHPDRLLVDAAELPLGDVAIIAAQLLLGAKLHAVVGELALATLAVLAGTVFAAIDRTLRTAPYILAHPAVD